MKHTYKQQTQNFQRNSPCDIAHVKNKPPKELYQKKTLYMNLLLK